MSLTSKRQLERDLQNNFGFEPTTDQALALQMLSQFCLSMTPRECFLLKGYAGTGKTSLIRSLVKTLPNYKRKTALLAPTGRAAKVMGQYASKPAFTIHKYIYRPMQDGGGGLQFNLRENKASNTVYVVDEASMIHDGSPEGGSSLLNDLFRFVSEGVNCRLIFVGDMAQLPPVGLQESPALDASYLKVHYGWQPFEIEMKEVMRQVEGSQILQNATLIRKMQLEGDFDIPQITHGEDVVRLLEGFEVEDALNDSFAGGRENTAVLVRSNKRASLFNQQIRARILWQEDEISVGDYLMVVKNNYFWLPEKSKAGFIANGDTIELLELQQIKELYGYRFAHVKVRLVDYPDEPPLETVLLLDVLDKPAASLSWKESGDLYKTVMQDYAEIPQKYLRHKKTQENPYYNALQVKFAYAITGHKAQGGQWDYVFIERPWLPGNADLDYLRWLYTAFTRAKKKVYLLGFTPEYFND